MKYNFISLSLVALLLACFFSFTTQAQNLITVFPATTACSGTTVTLSAGSPVDVVNWLDLNGSLLKGNSLTYDHPFTGNISIVAVITTPNSNELRDTVMLTIDLGDNDNDGTPNCSDGCPNDPNKINPGICGCGASEADFDGDGVPNCIDGCPTDPNKSSPGVCGCGITDTNSDGDLLPDCFDQCPNDPNKLFPGACGCGFPETDSDGDGVPNCIDGCPFNAQKINPGACGCAILDADTDGDGILDCNDGCPFDANKIAPGQCGCGVADLDDDNDGIANCNDACPNDANKTQPGICGCGISDSDNDGDGVPNCNDQCPNDSNKTSPGACGCGVSEIDIDNDGTPDCNDQCPNDPNKIAPGVCGCNSLDLDTDNDGTLDCNDNCPNDPNKINVGQCGCGIADTDSDNDGIANCNDACPNDANKIAPGICGCGVADTDTDNDGTPDCNDQCPNDPNKVNPGQCGCGVADIDSDNDGAANCIDLCPNDPNKTNAGICGCGVADTDTDNDGTPDCNDQCPSDPNKIAPGVCGCGISDIDSDNDGIPDCMDTCPFGILELDTATTLSVCGSDGSATVSVISGGSGNHSYQWSNGGNGATINNLFPGVFGVTVFDNITGCSDSTETTVLPFPGSLFVLGFDTLPTSCLGGIDGEAEAIISGGIGPFSFLWSNNETTQRIVGLSAINYQVTVTDLATNCTGFGSVTVRDAAPFLVSLGTDKIICPGELVNLSISGSVNANWLDVQGNVLAANSLTLTFNPASSISVVVEALSSGGCIAKDTIQLVITPLDSDNDGTPDCIDACPNDANKIAPGFCGCGVSDADSDNDGTPDCDDECPFDSNKTEIGFCGCGISDIDSDNDGVPNCADNCPNDPNKIGPGICGCGISDNDTDNDGTPDCNDACPFDSNKVSPGTCGCGTPDNDTDGDGRPDCFDACPLDPGKTAPGSCGCGVADIDSDRDGTPDCNDECPFDANKIFAGQCNCGIAETDSDNDGTPDCNDNCPFDPLKTNPGFCGCGIPETDSDNDGVADCADDCPNDPNKIVAGFCGCGIPETDSDNDNIPDCADDCPNGDILVNKGSFNAICGPDGRTNISVSGSTNDFSFNWSNGATTLNLNNVFPGVYSVTITDNNISSCFITDTVIVNPAPNAFAIINIAVRDVTCAGLSDGAIFLQTQNNSGFIQYDWTPNVSSSDSAFNIPSGNYLITATNLQDGCESQVNVVVGTPLPFAIDLGSDKLVCSNSTTTLFLNSNDSINWLDANGSLLLANQDSFNFNFFTTTFIIAQAFNLDGCIATDTIILFRDSLDTDNDGTANCNDLCPNDPNKVAPGVCGCGVADIDTDNDGTPDCDDLCPNDPNRTTPGFCGCGVADTDTDNDGTPDCDDFCVSDANKTVPGICGCGVADIDSDGDGAPDCIDFCPNDANKTVPGICGCGIADADTDGDGKLDCEDACPFDSNKVNLGICGCGVADIDSDGDGVADCLDLCPNDSNKTAPGQCGCGVPDNFMASAGADQTICKGQAAILEATGGTDYIWNNGTIGSLNPVAPDSSSSFYVVITNGTCSKTDTVNVVVLPTPNVFAGNDTTVCAGDSILLEASGANLYSWSNNINSANNPILVSASDTLWVIGVDSNNCFSSDTVILSVIQPAPISVTNDTTICAGTTIELSISGGIKVLWNTGDSLSSILVSPMNNSIFSATVQDSVGCVTENNIQITVNPVPQIDAGPSFITCEGTSRTLTATGANEVVWSTGDTTKSITVAPLSTTVYSVSSTNSLNCTDSDSAIILVNPLPEVNLGNDTAVCENDVVQFAISSGVLFQWSTGDTSSSIILPVTTNQSLSVMVTDSNGCVNGDTIAVFTNALPTIDAGSDQTICAGEQAVLSAVGAQDYFWSTGQTVAAFVDTPDITTNYIVFGIDTNGCSNFDSINVVVQPLPELIVTGNTTLCLGDSLRLTALGGNIVIWNNTDTVSTFETLPNASSSYTVQIIDANGCSSTQVVDVTLNQTNSAEILGLNNAFCIGQTDIFLEAFPSGGVFSGTGVSGNIFNPQIAGEGSHIIQYIFTDTRGCISIDTATVEVALCLNTIDPFFDEWQLYPNPFFNQVVLKVNLPVGTTIHYKITDVSGKEIIHRTPIIIPDGQKAVLDLSQILSSGNYFIEFYYQEHQTTYKILKSE